MSSQGDSKTGTVLSQHPWSVFAGLTSLAFVVGFLKNTLADGKFGIDFGVFYTGGLLIGDEGFASAYDTEVFTAALTEQYSALAGTNNVSHFISTPTFGWFAQALGWLPFGSSMVVWFLVGLVALGISVRLLDLPLWVLLVLLISPAMTFNTMLGQTGPLVLLVFVAIHLAVSQERAMPAGLLAGLLILKPPLALGYGLLWLVQARRYAAAMATAAVTGIVLSIPTVLNGLGPWSEFLGAMGERAESEGRWSQQAFSVTEFLKQLAPQSSSAVTVIFWVIGLCAALAVVVAGHRRFGEDAEVMSAVAVIATVLGSPHLLMYDTFILLIPVAVAYRRGALNATRCGILAAIYSAAVVLGPVVFYVQYNAIGRGISPEAPALLVMCWLLVRWVDNAQGEPAEELLPVLTDA